MPLDLMWRGQRPSGPRAAIEFDQVFALMELDAEDKAATDTTKAESSELPPFVDPNKDQ